MEKSDKQDWKALKPSKVFDALALPLRLFDQKKNLLRPFAVLQQVDELRTAESFLIGTTSQLLVDRKELLNPDVVVHLPNSNKISKNNNHNQNDKKETIEKTTQQHQQPQQQQQQQSSFLSISIPQDSNLLNAVSLTLADRRFLAEMDELIVAQSNTVDDNDDNDTDQDDTSFVGSDDWIRHCFAIYLSVGFNLFGNSSFY